jgi:uncharacterized protein
MPDYKQTNRTKITRLPKRADYSEATVNQILDEALFCTLAFVHEGKPFQIPTGFCRIDNHMYIHGSIGSQYMRWIADGREVCIVAMLADGLVLARSAFHHSVNYRSVVLFSKARLVESKNEQYEALRVFTEKMIPGRWDTIRQPNESEWKKTMVLAFEITEVSAKVRTGPPKDDEEDYALPIWAGVLPILSQYGKPIADPALDEKIEMPAHLKSFI